jgi:ring-1,2-phenylacetyl-CoA epoxidase subunit PaaD
VVTASSIVADPATASRIERAWAVLDAVPDPEVPVLSVRDLGIVRDVVVDASDALEVVLTPTYSGCPATEAIEAGVVAALREAGLGPVRTTTRLSPAWSSDWISVDGRRKLHEYGIAPPHASGAADGAVAIRLVRRNVAVDCPRCGSSDTERLSAFGATACKALYRCRACREPFEYFKPI